MQKMLGRVHKDQKGITGLETAIILIAFVVVASVFAYTVLSAGIFSSEKGKEAVYSGLETARSSMSLAGAVVALDIGDDEDVDTIIITVHNTLAGEAIDLTTTVDSDADGVLSDEANPTHVVVMTLFNSVERIEDIAWTKNAIGKDDGDDLLEAGEKFELTIDVTGLVTDLAADGTFTIEIKPEKGSILTIERTLPAVIDLVMNLN